MKTVSIGLLAATTALGLAGITAPTQAAATPTAPAYDSPYDIRTAKRTVLRAFYRTSYSEQRALCRVFDDNPVRVVRSVGRTTYRNTPRSVSLREAQKGVIYALTAAC